MLTTQERQKEAERGKADFFETVESYLTECTGPDSIAVSWLQDMFSQKKYGYQTVIREYGRDREKTEKLLKTVGKAILLLEDIRETEEEYPLAVFSAEVSGNPHYFDQGTTGGQFIGSRDVLCHGRRLSGKCPSVERITVVQRNRTG